jgi:hypothetical protein
MRLEFAKIVACDLRLGAHTGKWEIIWGNTVTVKDINKNVFINITVDQIKKHEYKGKFFKKEISTKKGFGIFVDTGTINPERHLTSVEYEVWESDADYKIWEEFYTWIQFQKQDKIYKHELLVEEAFL